MGQLAVGPTLTTDQIRVRVTGGESSHCSPDVK